MQRPRDTRGGTEMLWQLPEMVHSLQKELYFYLPEEMVSKKRYQVFKFLKNFLYEMIFKKTVDRTKKEIRDLKETVRAKDNEISDLKLQLQKKAEDSNEINELESEKSALKKVTKPKKQPESPAQNIVMEGFTNSISSFDSTEYFDSISSSDSNLCDIVEWREFEFLTKKRGAKGPSKAECIQYYVKRLVFIIYNYFKL